MSDTSKIAVFFDAENVSSEVVPGIISFLSKQGDILYQRAYADWSVPNMKKWEKQISQTPITAIHQFHHKQEQAVDKVLMMDAVELAIEHDEIDIFAIVASDNGYHSLSRKLKNRGKKVIGIGDKEKCQAIWIQSCNEFRYFDELEYIDEEDMLAQEKTEDSELTEFALEKFLEQAFDMTPSYNNGNAVLLGQFWKSVLNKKPDFNVKNYGEKSVKAFISSFENIFKVYDDGKHPPTYFVEKIEPQSSSTGRKTGIIKRNIKSYRIIESDDGDYFFYIGEANKEYKSEKFTQGTKVEFQVTRHPDPNAPELKNKNGRATDFKIIPDK